MKGDYYNEKLISIALAAVMLAAASVPAFAANPITKETDNTGTAIVKTSTKQAPMLPMTTLLNTPLQFRPIPQFTGAQRKQLLTDFLLSLTLNTARSLKSALRAQDL